ncbi:DNA-directed DNA polymerase II small subunit [Halovivax limisalsi]|uniref:DNA-directed DNA polymerase II small subunit n=1 Tax=Halovivax limisalsi TaxID=1453760 RepID=UPI001FFDE163|nr:DNA-directed DNA polymerase II small subunit [Halovivax limisalsi]
MPLEGSARIVQRLTSCGFNVEREAVTLIAGSADPSRTVDRLVEELDDDVLVIATADVRAILETGLETEAEAASPTRSDAALATDTDDPTDREARPTGATPDGGDVRAEPSPSADGHDDPSISTGTTPPDGDSSAASPPETEGVREPSSDRSSSDEDRSTSAPDFERSGETDARSVEIEGDMTGQSTGTGAYRDFVTVFRDRLERLGSKLRGRVNHRPASSIESMPGGSDVAMVGLVNDVRSTASGHWLVELEDTTGTFPFLVMKDRDFAGLVDELLCDEVLAMEGTLADDSGIAFVDSIHFPDVPRTHEPSTADRHVQAALISDVHVGSEEFMAGAWNRFAEWLHSEAAQHVEYLCIAGDMVEGVGIYPDQDEELDIVDIYDQYEAFNEHLKRVPGDLEIVMIPGNHDAVRLAEPQPGFDEELRSIMSAHDARISSNPSVVDLEGVSILMYHGVSLDEVIAELPAESASYDEPHKAMYQLLKKRHVAPQFGGHTRLAPEERDYLVIEDVPDIFHTGHVHKLGFGKYHDVLAINSGCWQAQTDFQKSVNIDPDAGFAPIVDLDTLDVTVQKFR